MIYNISVLSNIADAIEQALRTFFGKLSALIYSLIEYLYDVFVLISRAEFLDSNLVNGIYKKVGMILGIFMLFKLIFSLIQSLVEPEKFNDDKKGYVSIIKRSVIAIVLLGITPSIFSEAFNIQNLIIGSDNSNNVIYKLVVGESSNNIENMGRTIAANLYFSFYTDDEYPYYDGEGNYIEEEDKDRFKIIDYNTIVENVENKDMSFYETVDYLSLKVNYQYIIEFNEILSMLLGAVVAWMLVLYCIQAGTRVIQLGYLQLIAPIPILSYISDPEGSFKNWIKQCTSTYLDLFIRLAIIYFIMTILADVLGQFNKTDSLIMTSTGLISGTFTATLVKIFIVIGLLMFAKKVPELLKELFPNLGGGAAGLGFGIKSPKKTLEDIPLLKGAATFGLGTAVGGIAGMATGIKNGYGFKGKLAGAFGGFNRGIAGGAKTKGNILKNVQGGMNSTRQARQRVLDKRIYKIDNAKVTKEYQENEAVIAAKKAMDDRAESQLLKSDSGAQAAQARLNYIESNVGEIDISTGRVITTADVVAQRVAYKTYMDTAKATWINDPTKGGNDAEIAKQMQIIQNKTGKSITNYSDADTAANTAKTRNAGTARTVTKNEDKKEKMQTKKSKIK